MHGSPSDHSLFKYGILCLVVLGVIGCGQEKDRLFQEVPASQTGVHFKNPSVDDDSLLRSLKVNHVFSEGGVAIADVNNDGRPDLYFTGILGRENELYLNQGDMTFREVTETAGVEMDSAWSKGVAVVDINQDGRNDLYVSVGGRKEIQPSRRNRLYVNQGTDEKGVPSFVERAAEYGIDDSSYSTQAAFFDYDRDGDLDLYLLNKASGDRGRVTLRRKLTEGESPSTDRLYRNNGDGTFTDVSEAAGIQIEGQGLGVAISDINHDGWPDVYVANDFLSNDLLYINNGDGTFTNRIDDEIKYQPYSAMGVDVADVNNDQWNDIFVLDMLPPGRSRNQMMSRFFDQKTFQRALTLGYEPQYVRNMLHLNNGPRPSEGLSFSEVAQQVGIAGTDWSWAPLLADFDNDGDRDLFVSNGYGKDMTNLDYATRQEKVMAFGTAEAQEPKIREEVNALSEVSLPNRLFENEGDLSFSDRTGEWAASEPGLSTGAAIADLDGDGDLDIVTNNMDEKATVLENQASENSHSNAVRIDLHGPTGNRGGLGTKLILTNDGTTQYYEHSPYRGYQSTVQPIAHFGVGADSTADSLSVVWPDGRTHVLTNVPTGSVLDLRYEEASAAEVRHASEVGVPRHSDTFRFQHVARDRGLDVEHDERDINEFEQTPILPHQLSQEGPGLAAGDINGDGRDDLFVGADKGEASFLLRQTERGSFERTRLAPSEQYEDRGALLFDADGDGDRDLYVVSGGPVRASNRTAYQDRLYRNDGTGHFRRAPQALPSITASGSVVRAADYDGDGDLDLFVGGRVRPGEYPLRPRSYLLRNDSNEGTLTFTDVTEDIAPGLVKPGLVTDALWTDYNKDGRVDLIVMGEWMPITVFKNGESGFTDVTEEVGLDGTSGWWWSLAAGDFDTDGDTEYVAGNVGLNTRYDPSLNAPLRVYAKDYDRNGQIDPVVTHVDGGTRYPLPRRDEMIAQIPGLKSRFPTYQAYAEASFSEVFTESEREGAYVGEAVRFESSYIENQGDGTFSIRSLPRSVQTAPVFGMESGDYDGDGNLDVLMVGNWYAPNMRTGRAGAFTGAYLEGMGTGRFSVHDGTESGFFVDGDAKALARVATGGDSSIVVATQNSGTMKAFKVPRSDSTIVVSLRPLDQSGQLRFEDGRTRRVEFYYGSSYLSQSSRMLQVPPSVEEVSITNSEGERRTIDLTDRF